MSNILPVLTFGIRVLQEQIALFGTIPIYLYASRKGLLLFTLRSLRFQEVYFESQNSIHN